MQFDDIIGQNKIKKVLLRSIKNNRVSHSYIIEGEKGMGKKLMAYTFANYLVCENGCACGICSGCMLAKAGSHPDIITVFPEEDRKTIGVADVREIILKAQIKPYSAKKKVIIFTGDYPVTAAAQNAMLKIIEEPPAYIVFIILVQSSEELLETVRSRSVTLSMERSSNDEIEKALGINGVNPYILAYSDGNIGKARSLTEDENFIALRDEFFEVITGFISQRHYDVFKISSFMEKHDGQKDTLLDFMLSIFRDITLIKCENAGLMQNIDKKNIIMEMEEKISMAAAVEMVGHVLNTKQMLAYNVNSALAITELACGGWEVIHGRNNRRSL